MNLVNIAGPGAVDRFGDRSRRHLPHVHDEPIGHRGAQQRTARFVLGQGQPRTVRTRWRIIAGPCEAPSVEVVAAPRHLSGGGALPGERVRRIEGELRQVRGRSDVGEVTTHSGLAQRSWANRKPAKI